MRSRRPERLPFEHAHQVVRPPPPQSEALCGGPFRGPGVLILSVPSAGATATGMLSVRGASAGQTSRSAPATPAADGSIPTSPRTLGCATGGAAPTGRDPAPARWPPALGWSPGVRGGAGLRAVAPVASLAGPAPRRSRRCRAGGPAAANSNPPPGAPLPTAPTGHTAGGAEPRRRQRPHLLLLGPQGALIEQEPRPRPGQQPLQHAMPPHSTLHLTLRTATPSPAPQPRAINGPGADGPLRRHHTRASPLGSSLVHQQLPDLRGVHLGQNPLPGGLVGRRQPHPSHPERRTSAGPFVQPVAIADLEDPCGQDGLYHLLQPPVPALLAP
jgi:hypothetical protein